MSFIKTTVIGGLLFLVPIVALGVVLGKVYQVMLAVTEPMAAFIPVDFIGGVAIANVIAVLVILLLCFLAGLVARAGPARKLAESIENAILQKIPGYSLFKGFASSLSTEQTADIKAVLVTLGPSSRVGLKIEEIGDDRAAVYFPDAPNAWSGRVHIVGTDQITPIDAPMTAVIEHAEQLGRGSHDILGGLPR